MKHSRTVDWDDPFEIAADIHKLAGIDFLRQLIEKNRNVPISVTLGFKLAEVSDGVAVFEAEAGPWAYNPIGSVHGGWYGAVLDAALGCALHTQLPARVGYTTLEYKVNVVRGVRPDTGVLRATGKVVHRGRSTGVTEARMEDREGRLYAFATSTCLIFEAKKSDSSV